MENKKISLILCTFKRKREPLQFLKSLESSSYSNFEVIIIEQNSQRLLEEAALRKFEFKIKYHHVKFTGLSVSRNYGLKFAEGELVGFPDGDCLYYQDTLSKVVNHFIENPKNEVVLGRIYDVHNNTNILKNFPKKKTKLNRINFFSISSSIVIFSQKNKYTKFDESMGIGANNGSCEDCDFIYERLSNKIFFDPQINVWHPEQDLNYFNPKKIRAYSKGFGYFIQKKMDVYKFLLMIGFLSKRVLQFASLKLTMSNFLQSILGFWSGIRKL